VSGRSGVLVRVPAQVFARLLGLAGDEILAALRRHLDPDRLTIIRVGHFARAVSAGDPQPQQLEAAFRHPINSSPAPFRPGGGSAHRPGSRAYSADAGNLRALAVPPDPDHRQEAKPRTMSEGILDDIRCPGLAPPPAEARSENGQKEGPRFLEQAGQSVVVSCPGSEGRGISLTPSSGGPREQPPAYFFHMIVSGTGYGAQASCLTRGHDRSCQISHRAAFAAETLPLRI
jgi:hypothetical protein